LKYLPLDVFWGGGGVGQLTINHSLIATLKSWCTDRPEFIIILHRMSENSGVGSHRFHCIS